MSILGSSKRNGHSTDAAIFAEASQLAQLRLEQWMAELHIAAPPTINQAAPQEQPDVAQVHKLRLEAHQAQARSQL